MSAAFQPVPWNHFAGECLIYLLFVGILHLAVFVFGCLVLTVLPRKRPGALRGRIGRFGLFGGVALVVGSVFNGFWSCLVWGRLYSSSDYVFDFTPFWPVTQRVIDVPFFPPGQLLGVSLFQLQMVWFVFAAGAWGVTIFVYRLVRKYQPAHRQRIEEPGES